MLQYLRSNDVQSWNQWRQSNVNNHIDLSSADLRNTELDDAKFVGVDLLNAIFANASLRRAGFREVNLKGADFRETNLCRADLIGSNLSYACLSEAKLIETYLIGADCTKADFTNAHIGQAHLSDAILSGANFKGAYLGDANLSGADLSDANLQGAALYGANLRKANLSRANLYGANLNGANLNGANLEKADLKNANLDEVNMLRANLTDTVLTGACIKDWNISQSTSFGEMQADYVYLHFSWNKKLSADEFTDRRPEFGIFKSGEFAARFQWAMETIDIFFKDGIDWSVFFETLQDSRNQYADETISIQSLESRGRGTLIVRLAVSSQADKTAIEESLTEQYKTKLFLKEEHYRDILKLKDQQIADCKRSNADLMNIVTQSHMPSSQIFINSPVGNAVGTNHGDISAIQNNYGASAEDIAQLISSLRSHAQTFPAEHQEEAFDVLSALEIDIKQPQPDRNRISRWLKKLIIAGSAAGAITGGAANFSDDLHDFMSNITALSESIGISIEQIQPPESFDPKT